MQNARRARSAPAYFAKVLEKLNETSTSDLGALFKISDGLLESFHSALQTSKTSMLPSFTDSLPDGHESGSTVALDLGGSTLRVAVIQLRPHVRLEGADPPHLPKLMQFTAKHSWAVSDTVKKLPSDDFFDWIASRIAFVVHTSGLGNGGDRSLGVTWSFPVELLSHASGLVQEMGKGYEQWRTIGGTDLKGHIDAALRRANIRLRMTSLMNDTEATLLSHAYANPATRISLIWGTGLNAAVYLPLCAVGECKLKDRPLTWMQSAQATVVNTEISMFGTGLLPLSDADLLLDANSSQPGFQPLEQMTSGRYLGEICRLILVEAVKHEEIFGGSMPKGLENQFSFDTSICSAFEEQDPTSGPRALGEAFQLKKPLSSEDVAKIRLLCQAISTRAAALIAVMLFTLYKLQRDLHSDGQPSPALPQEYGSDASVAIGFCGAVPEKHATALRKCQDALDVLVENETVAVTHKRRLVLEAAGDSGLLGAAVGAVMHESLVKLPAKL